MKNKIQCGKPYPLGATVENDGVNFAIFSKNTTKVILCLFEDINDPNKVVSIELPMKTRHVHHGFVPGLKAEQLYGYRIEGPYEPMEGHRFNPNKLLLDPYAKAIAGAIKWDDALLGYNKNEGDLSFNDLDSAPFVPRCVVLENKYDWEGDVLLNKHSDDLVIYEINVKGFSQLLPGIPDNLRGKFSALAHPVVLDYFSKLGITALELMPIQFYISDAALAEKGLTNYWGYNTLAFFAPHAIYSSTGMFGEQVNEFKDMVKTLHQHGIKVIMDVVYNHTGEGTELGPTLGFRGIDNKSYYRLEKDKPNLYKDYTGTGNTLDVQQPWVLQLIMDSLRYWITDMHVDGFRFDLAPTLARGGQDVDQSSSFFSILYQDPIISQVKLIAEPWDVGDGGYQVGNFPINWAEWNGKYRNDVRDYWKGEPINLKTMVLRLLGSPDIYKKNGRTPAACINFITAHDGYTLHDLVTYVDKHNEKNGSNNTDGNDENKSKNWGTEGETDNEAINRLRKLHVKNLLTTLFISQGVPMLLTGDEIGNSKGGNNNSYAQDNETNWISWDKLDQDLLDFTRNLIKLRKENPLLNQAEWMVVENNIEVDKNNAELFDKEGEKVSFDDCEGRNAAVFGMLLSADNHSKNGKDKNRDSNKASKLFLIFNNLDKPIDFCLPIFKHESKWCKIIDTNKNNKHQEETDLLKEGDRKLAIGAFSIVVLKKENN